MISLQDFVFIDIIKERIKQGITINECGVDFQTGCITDITFTEFLNSVSDNWGDFYENNQDTLWRLYINAKYGISDSHSLIRTDNEYRDRLCEAYCYDALNENLGAAEQDIIDNFKPTRIKREGKTHKRVKCIGDPLRNTFCKVRSEITSHRKLTDDELKELKEIASKHQCYADFLKEKETPSGIKYIYFLEEDEDKYLENVDNFVYKKCKGILWHLTTKENAEKILKNGLEVREDRKLSTHPPRIYFLDFNTSNKNIKEYSKQLFKDVDENQYALLKIDLNKFNEPLRFFRDETTLGCDAYFVRKPIPAKCISEVNIDKLNKERLLIHFDNIKTKTKNSIKDFLSSIFQ